MPRRSRASDMRNKVDFYKQINVRNNNTGEIEQVWKFDFSLFCREKTIFREQLERVRSGSNLYRKRLEMECRYTNRITSAHRCVYRGDMYEISIVGDTSGTSDTTRFLIETMTEGGAT